MRNSCTAVLKKKKTLKALAHQKTAISSSNYFLAVHEIQYVNNLTFSIIETVELEKPKTTATASF